MFFQRYADDMVLIADTETPTEGCLGKRDERMKHKMQVDSKRDTQITEWRYQNQACLKI